MMMMMIIIIIIIIKCRGRSRTLITTNTELPVTLNTGQKPLTNIAIRSTSDAPSVLYEPLKWRIPFKIKN